MHTGHAELVTLLVLLGGSFAMPLLFGRLGIPSAVGLMAYGLLTGPQGLDWLTSTHVVDFLYEVGFIVLMFLAGVEIDFNGIRQRGIRSLLSVVLVCLAFFGLSFLVAFAFSLHPIYGLTLGATSVGLPLAVLKESGQVRSPLGQLIILVGSVGEFLTVIGMTLLYFSAKHGLSWNLVWGLGKLMAVLAVAGVVLRLLMALAWWYPERFSRLVAEEDGSEIGVRAAVLLAIAFSSLAVLAGVESIVGAFVAGALIAFVLRGKEVLEEKLAAVGHGLFVPIFFIVVGMRFDPAAITGPNLAFAGLLLSATFAVRLLPCLALLRQGLSARELLGAVSLLSAPLTLVVAIAAVGLSLGALQTHEKGTLIVLAVAAGVLFPILYRLSQPVAPPTEQG